MGGAPLAGFCDFNKKYSAFLGIVLCSTLCSSLVYKKNYNIVLWFKYVSKYNKTKILGMAPFSSSGYATDSVETQMKMLF